MWKYFFIIFVFSVNSNFLISQSPKPIFFNLSDSNIEVGQRYVTREIIFENFGRCKFREDTMSLIRTNEELLRLFYFLNENKQFVIEIGVFNNGRPSTISSRNGICQPNLIISYLIKKGIPLNRLNGRNYFSSLPLVDYETILGVPFEDQIELLRINNRVEVKIVDILK